MNIIEHAILINAAPDIVWDYISNIKNHPKWQVDCDHVAFISTNHKGMSTRWRYEDNGKRSYIAEITAWYERLGYEYSIIDGAPFQQNKGRIRLQEVPEGTIVQWTFMYQTTGLIGGIRNSISIKRTIQTQITEGLRGLYRQMLNLQSSNDQSFAPKSLMQDAPNVEERSLYQSRRAAASDLDFESQRTASASIFEPPLSDEDTRPTGTFKRPELPNTQEANPPPALPRAQPAAENPYKPADIPEQPAYEKSSENSSIFRSQTSGDHEPELTPIVNSPYSLITYDEEEESPEPEQSETQSPAFQPTIQEPVNRVSPFTTPLTPPEIQKVDIAQETRSDADNAKGKLLNYDKLDITDTAEVSVFELFGLRKPSESQQIPRVVLNNPEEEAPAKAKNEALPPAETSTEVSSIQYDEIPTICTKRGFKFRKRQQSVMLRQRQ